MRRDDGLPPRRRVLARIRFTSAAARDEHVIGWAWAQRDVMAGGEWEG